MRYFLLSLLCVFALTSCEQAEEEKEAQLVLKPASYAALPGWGIEGFEGVSQAFGRSCERILRASSTRKMGALEQAGTYGDWQPVCTKFIALVDGESNSSLQAFRRFFEENFQPYQVLADEEPEGLFTGYYESSLRGSREKIGPYKYPLYTRPDDLIMVQLGDFREDLKGRRIAGRVIGGNLKPYESRTEIVAGKWPHNDKVLLWVDDPVDAFFVQIQGSGMAELSDGSIMRIGYAGQNGHPYYAIGRELIKRGHLSKDNVSMQAIREWLGSNPAEADEIMNTNASYVFFRELTGDGPLGGEGVALTPERSLAVDRSLWSYGVPLWVNIEAPTEGADPLQRMMIAQDTGGAIRGPVRGDVFWGHGEHASNMAGGMKSKGRYWALLPKELKVNVAQP